MVGGGNGERDPWKAAGSDGGGGDDPPQRPTITLPPRNSMETLFNGGLSPGPMTLVSSFFADGGGDEFKSFSQLLAGAMTSPVAGSTGLQVDSHASFFSPAQGPLGMTHQQGSSHGGQSSRIDAQPQQHSFSFTHAPAAAAATSSNTNQGPMPPMRESSECSMQPGQRILSEPNSSLNNVDKPADDGYNWRKYGQKQVKGSEFPRSYYKCTHAGCPVKKKVERSLDGHITAIIYKGEHNHQPPLPNNNKRSKDAVNSNDAAVDSAHHQGTTASSVSRMDAESSQVSGTSDSEELGDREAQADDKLVEPDPKRRNTEIAHSDPASSHRTVTEPRIIVQTTSEVDLLDDGYRWRKYGQKVVKGNPYPRSYYKCTTQGCNVRKHVERASTDPKAVITTYEGKHNHDVPAAKTNSHTIANDSAQQMLRPQNNTPEMHSFGSRGIGANEQQQQPVARLRLKEEQMT